MLEWARPGRADLDALDVGTGSGCIALSLLTEGSFRRVVATDASAEALAVTTVNACRAGLAERLETRLGPLFEPLAPGEAFDVVVSNPPYVADAEAADLEPEVRDWEPAAALFSGAHGLDALDAIVAGAGPRIRPGGLLALEVGLGQAAPVAERVRAAGGFTEPRIVRDLAGRQRIVLAERG